MAKTLYQIIVSLEGDKEVAQGLNSIGVQAGLATAALGAITVKAREAAIEYDAALRKFNTIANETTGTIEQQRQAFTDLTDALKNGITVTEALNAGYEVLSSGYQNLNDVTGILEKSQKAAIGGFSDLTTVADAVTTVLNVYGNTYGEAATVTEKANDILSQAITVQNLGKITVDEYARSIGILAPTAKAAGVGLSEMNAAIALSTSRGIRGQTAIRGYRQLLVNLIRPTESATRAAEANGIALGAQALATEGYSKILEKIIDTAKKNPGIVSEIFTDVDSLNIANVLVNNSELLNRFVKEAETAAQKGILEAQFEIVSESDAEKQKRLLNLINEAFVDLGIGVVNSLEPLIEAVSAALQAFKNAPDEIKQFAGALATIIVAAGGFTTSVIAGRSALIAFNTAIKAVGISTTTLAASLGVFTAAAVVASEAVNTFQAISNAAKSTEDGIRALEEQYQRFLDTQAETGNAEAEFNAIAFSIEKTNQAIAESISPIGKFSDSVIVAVRNAVKGFNELIDRIPLVPKAIKEAIKGITPLGAANFLGDDSVFVTRAEAAANKIKVELDNALQKSTDIRLEIGNIDFNKASVEELREGLNTLLAAKDALNKTRFTTEEDAREIEREKLLLDGQIKQLNALAEARGLSLRSTIETTEAVENQADAQARLTKELTETLKLLEAQANAQLKQVDTLRVSGQISDVEAIEQSAAIEAKLVEDKRSRLQQLLEDQRIQGEARVEIERQVAQLLIDSEANAAERITQINRAKLDEITRLRDRDIAEIRASGESELEIARRINQVKVESARKEAEEINRQLATAKAGSTQRIELETRLFNLQAEIARDREELARKEIAAIDQEINKRLESVELEERLARAMASDPVAKNQAELRATERRLQVLKEIAQTEGLNAGTVAKLQADIAEAEAKRLDLNRAIAKEIADNQTQALRSQFSLQEQLIRFEQDRLSASQDLINAQNGLIGAIRSGLSSIVSPIESLRGAYERAGSAAQALAQFDRDRANALRDQRLQDIRIPEGASESERSRIEAENRRRQAQRERIAQRREQEELARRRAELVRAEAREREELAKKEQEAQVAIRQRAILQQELAKLGIQLNSTGDVANDIKQAQIQLQILELENQQKLNDLKLQQQELEIKNLQLQQQAIIAEENLKIQSGTLNDQELAAARLRLQLAQNQLAVTKEQQANIRQTAALQNQGLALQQRLAQAQVNPASLQSGRTVAMSDKGKPEEITKPITDALSRLGTAEQITSAISRLEAVSGNILSATQQLPRELARAIPKPVVPR